MPYSIVLKNPPPTTTPEERKQFLMSMCGEDLSVDDGELKRGRSEWRLVVKTKVKANSIASSINQKLQSAGARVKSPVFIGVIKNIPTTYDADRVKNCLSGCERAEQCGRSRTYKLYFSSCYQLGLAMKSPTKLEFEHFPIEEFVYLPKRCYNYQKFGHISAACSAPQVCPRCGVRGHASNATTPCTNPIGCVACKSTKHTCQSFQCPEMKKQIGKQKRSNEWTACKY